MELTTFAVGWLGGWLENWRVMLISTQIVVEIEIGVELGNKTVKIILNCYNLGWVRNKRLTVGGMKLTSHPCVRP